MSKKDAVKAQIEELYNVSVELSEIVDKISYLTDPELAIAFRELLGAESALEEAIYLLKGVVKQWE